MEILPTMRFLILIIAFLSSHLTYSQTINGELDDPRDLVTIETKMLKMSDGTALATDLYLPVTRDSLVVNLEFKNHGKGSIMVIPKGIQYLIYDSIDDTQNSNPYQLPILLTRTPYSRTSTDLYGVFVSLLGYTYAIQDMRGTYGSQGAYLPMYSDGWNKNVYHPDIHHLLDITGTDDPRNANKHEDGYETILNLTDSLVRSYDIDADGQLDTFNLSNGSIGMFGASALANSQYSAAAAHKIDPEQAGLKSLFPIVGTADHHGVTLVQNGVYREAIVDEWISNQLSTINDAALNDLDSGIDDTIHSFADYNLQNAQQASRMAIGTMVDSSVNGHLPGYYPNSPIRASMDASYAPVDSSGEGALNGTFSRFGNLDVPAYHLTGWWDIFIDGQIATFNKTRAAIDDIHGNRSMQKLVIGPWAHQTISQQQTGDISYPENVKELLGINLADLENIAEAEDNVFESELYKWFRHTLNERQGLGDPKFIIPESDLWQPFSSNLDIRIPATDYVVPYSDFVAYIGGLSTLDSIPVELASDGDTAISSIDFPLIDEPFFNIENKPPGSTGEYFQNTSTVRFYIPGPVDDGLPENANKGNYWFHTDSFPVDELVSRELFYLHANGSLNNIPPGTDEGILTYLNNPDAPVLTVGGANMTIKTPDDNRKSQGQINMADPDLVQLTMEHPGVISFESEPVADSLSIIGFPKARLFASSHVPGQTDVPTNTDFFVRIVDVYPNGKEYFVVEGAVNARARTYAASIYEEGQENPEALFSNIISDQFYEYKFNLMPIAYTFGKNHRIKVLISSSNHPRYMANANLPLNEGEFFRRKPNDGQSYEFDGTLLNPRIIENSIAFSPNMPGSINLPVYGDFAFTDISTSISRNRKVKVFPNPADTYIRITPHAATKNSRVDIYSIDGRLIKSGRLSSSGQMNIGDFEAGVYILTLSTEQDTHALKFIKQ